VTGKEFCSFVILKDSLESPGQNLLRCWEEELKQRYPSIVSLPCGTMRKYTGIVIDCLEPVLKGSKDLSSLLTRLRTNPLFPSSGPIAFLLPDLDTLFLFHPPPDVFQFLNSLAGLLSPSFLIGLLHRDSFPTAIMPSLDFLASTSVTILPPPLTSGSFSCLVDVTHKKASGKVLRAREIVRLAPDPPRLLSVTDASKNTSTSTSAPTIAYEPETGDPTANLTFNLSLSEEEKTARDKVVMPFAKTVKGQGKIIYEAEDEDDFDEEDPDDDLNI